MQRKIIALFLVLTVFLCGCGMLGETIYVVVEPHEEDTGISPESDVITVSSYPSLKNAILRLVEDGQREGVIRTESYQGALQEDLSQAVEEITENTPLGAFAVDRMTYDYSRIVGYYEIHINTTFRRSAEEIQSVEYVADTDAVCQKTDEAMAVYAPSLILQVGEYTPFDLQTQVSEIYQAHPEFALEEPAVTVTAYPETGSQRILEISFTYTDSPEHLLECQEWLTQELAQLATLYRNANSEMITAMRLYGRLGRGAVTVPNVDGVLPLTNSAYGALAEHCATSFGFAQAYRLLLQSCGVECQLVSGLKDGSLHSWCLAKLDGAAYYIDPSAAAETDFFLMGSEELTAGGYVMWNGGDFPQVELPEYLKPIYEAQPEG